MQKSAKPLSGSLKITRPQRAANPLTIQRACHPQRTAPAAFQEIRSAMPIWAAPTVSSLDSQFAMSHRMRS
jgi:hypothetical protein